MTNNNLKVAYFGTPIFSARFLKNILEMQEELGYSIDLVVTQPDKPVGRDQKLTPSPVKQIAEKNGIEVVHKVSPDQLHDFDIVLLYAYGKIITQKALDAPQFGFWNIHPSMLPKYRGASPTVYPLLLGDTSTGVTLMRMDADLDHGPIIAQHEYEIGPGEKNFDVINALTDEAIELWEKALEILEGDKKNDLSKMGREQDHSKATFTRTLKRDDGYIDIALVKKLLSHRGADDTGEGPAKVSFDELPAITKDYYSKNSQEKYTPQPIDTLIFNMWRALDPWPGIWTEIEVGGTKKRLKITEMELKDGHANIKTVQLEGKKPALFEQVREHLEL